MRFSWDGLKHPVVLSSGMRVLALVVGVLGSVVIARLGGVELKGVSSTYAAANALAFALLNVDAGQTALRESRRVQDKAVVWAVLGRVWTIYLCLALSSLALLIMTGASVYWVLLGGVAFALGTQAGLAAVGLRGALVGSFGAVVQQLTLILAVVIAAVPGSLNETTIKISIVISYVVPLGLYIPMMRTAAERGAGYEIGAKRLIRLLWRGLPWQLGRLTQSALQKLDVLFLAALAGTAAVGVYSVGLATAMLCTIVPAQISSHVLFRAVNDRRDRVKIGRQLWFALIAGALPAIVLGLLGQQLIVMLYGEAFSSAYPSLLACLPGAVAYGLVQVQTNFVRIQGSWAPFFTVGVISVIILVIGLLLLVPFWGEPGAGLAFSAATVCSVLLGLWLFRPPARRE